MRRTAKSSFRNEINYAIKNFEISRFIAHCDSENIASRAVMEKFVVFITISMLLFTLVGCSLNSSSNKIPNNLLGIKEISKEGLTAKIVLNENYISGEKYLSLTHYEDFRVSCTLSNVNKMNNDYNIKKRGSDVIITITGIYDEDVVRDKNKPDEKHSVDWHISEFEHMAKKLAGYTTTCVISFIDIYKKVEKNFPRAREVSKKR